MKVLLAGGVYRRDQVWRSKIQPTPEMILEEGLVALGFEVETAPLEQVDRIARARGVDLVHVHHLCKASIACAVNPVRRVPMVFTQHAAIPASTSRRFALRLVLERASVTVCLSNAERANKLALVRRRSGAQLVTIPNGLPGFGSMPTNVLRHLDGGLRLLFVGGLKPVKQVDRIIRALPQLPQSVTLTLVYHEESLEAELRALAEGLGVGTRVRFLGKLSGDALGEAYLRADVLVLPSKSESLPSCVTEALMTGLPVIASDCEGVPEQVGAAGICVDAHESHSLVPAIEQLWSDYSRYSEAAHFAMTRVFDAYSPQRMVEAHAKLYRSLS